MPNRWQTLQILTRWRLLAWWREVCVWLRTGLRVLDVLWGAYVLVFLAWAVYGLASADAGTTAIPPRFRLGVVAMAMTGSLLSCILTVHASRWRFMSHDWSREPLRGYGAIAPALVCVRIVQDALEATTLTMSAVLAAAVLPLRYSSLAPTVGTHPDFWPATVVVALAATNVLVSVFLWTAGLGAQGLGRWSRNAPRLFLLLGGVPLILIGFAPVAETLYPALVDDIGGAVLRMQGALLLPLVLLLPPSPTWWGTVALSLLAMAGAGWWVARHTWTWAVRADPVAEWVGHEASPGFADAFAQDRSATGRMTQLWGLFVRKDLQLRWQRVRGLYRQQLGGAVGLPVVLLGASVAGMKHPAPAELVHLGLIGLSLYATISFARLVSLGSLGREGRMLVPLRAVLRDAELYRIKLYCAMVTAMLHGAAFGLVFTGIGRLVWPEAALTLRLTVTVTLVTAVTGAVCGLLGTGLGFLLPSFRSHGDPLREGTTAAGRWLYLGVSGVLLPLLAGGTLWLGSPGRTAAGGVIVSVGWLVMAGAGWLSARLALRRPWEIER